MPRGNRVLHFGGAAETVLHDIVGGTARLRVGTVIQVIGRPDRCRDYRGKFPAAARCENETDVQVFLHRGYPQCRTRPEVASGKRSQQADMPDTDESGTGNDLLPVHGDRHELASRERHDTGGRGLARPHREGGFSRRVVHPDIPATLDRQAQRVFRSPCGEELHRRELGKRIDDAPERKRRIGRPRAGQLELERGRRAENDGLVGMRLQYPVPAVLVVGREQAEGRYGGSKGRVPRLVRPLDGLFKVPEVHGVVHAAGLHVERYRGNSAHDRVFPGMVVGDKRTGMLVFPERRHQPRG